MREDNSAKLHELMNQISSSLQSRSAHDYARIEVEGISVVLSSAEIRAFRAQSEPSALLLRTVVAVRAFLSASLRNRNSEMQRSATIIGSDMLREVGAALKTAEQARDTELLANLHRAQRHIEELLSRCSRA